MEKTVSFSIIKDKIIKTNLLINVVKEKEKLLEESQKYAKFLKVGLERSKSEKKKLNEFIVCLKEEITASQKSFEELTAQHEELKKKFACLEDETNQTINNLQINYQSSNQKLREAEERLEKLLQQEPKKSPVRKRKVKESDSVQKSKESDLVFISEIKKLQSENEKLKSEHNELLLEVYELRKKVKGLDEGQSDFLKLTNLKNALESRNEEIGRIEEERDRLREESRRNNVKIEELKSQISELRIENERLKDENCSYRVEMSLVNNKEDTFVENKKNEIVEEERTPSDEEISEIMKQMTVPSSLSPLMESPIKELAQRLSPPDFEKIQARKRHLIKKRRLARKKYKNVDLFGTLLALKKAKINFIISNNSLVPSNTPKILYHRPKKYKSFEKKKCTMTRELNCSLNCCKSIMVLKEDEREGDALLLGFVGVKNEDFVKERENVQIDEVVDISNEISASKINCDNRIKSSLSVIKKRKMTDKLKGCQSTDPEEVLKKPKPVSGARRSSRLVASDNTEEKQTNPNEEKSPPKTPFKRPVCMRRSLRLGTSQSHNEEEAKSSSNDEEAREENLPVESPRSPSPDPDQQKEKEENPPDEVVFKKPISPPKTFKRPVCTTRRSLRLVTTGTNVEERREENLPVESPRSPSPERGPDSESPVLIPLEKIEKSSGKLPTSKIEMLFNKLILYSAEEEALNEVVKEFSSQEPQFIAEAILERISLDFHDAPDNKHAPAPPMTDVQRTFLGFMSKLEKTSVSGVFDSYLTLAEGKLITCTSLQEFGPVTRLYLGVCKQKKDITRVRKLCCDVFYFCGDFAVPFLFTVLTTWTRVLPHEADSKDFPIARVLVQLVYTKECNKPGFNLMPLRDLLIKFYGYPTERWDHNKFFEELFENYLSKPSRSTDFPLLLYCKYMPEKWVHEKIEEHLGPLLEKPIHDNFKATVVILIGNLYSRFSSKSEVNYLPKVREWLTSLVKEGTPDVVKRCIYVSLHRLRNK